MKKTEQIPQSPSLVVVTGKPCTGKTAIANTLSEEYSLPLFSKDSVKEILFDTMGFDDRDLSKRYGVAAYALLDYLIEENLNRGRSLMVESNFNPDYDNEKFQNWQARYGAVVLQIVCETDGEVLFNRFADRARSQERHPGHNDLASLEEWKPILTSGSLMPLDIEGEVIRVDTTSFEDLDLTHARTAISHLLN